MGRHWDDSDNNFSYNYKEVTTHDSYHYEYKMNWIVAVLVVVGAVVLLALLCRCCCGGKSRGRVLAPPTDNGTGQAPYPQQQYAPAPYNIAAMPVAVAAPPAGQYYPGAPYPTHHVVPLHAPPIIATGTIPAPYPQQHYVYAEALSPYPPAGPGAAPYPAPGGYPHPHPQPQPQPANAPTDHGTAFVGIAPPGWGAQACPPSYEQVMGAFDKQPPYNPNVPH